MAHLSMRKDKGAKSSVGFKDHWKRFTGGIMPTLSKLSKAFLLPIALLPIAGVFLGVGAAISANVVANSGAWYLGQVLNKMGDVAFSNLPILFCISVAMAYTKDSGVAAITAVVGFLVMNGIQAALLHTSGDLDAAGNSLYDLLWHHDIPNGLITSNVGITSLNTGVFAGIFVGAIAAKMYNKFHQTQLPSAISFFSGTKLVPIMTFFAVIPLSFIFIFLWPYVGKGLAEFGSASGKLPGGLDSFIFEAAERSLVPFGLHHVFYAPLWWTNAGGSIAESFTSASAQQQSDFVATWTSNHSSLSQTVFASLTDTSDAAKFQAIETYISGNYSDLYSAMGDQTMAYKVIAHADVLNYTDLEKLGLNIGRFQSGKFGFMLLGLPMAGLAMWLNVPKQNRKAVMGIYFSAAFTCFLTGITEPIEYTFLFLAPWLFYGVHMPLAAISFLLAGLTKTHVSMTVSGGLIDYIVFGLVPYFGAKAMTAGSTFWILAIAVGMAPLYFFGFYFGVKYGKVMVPGRDGSTDAKLATKADYKASKGLNVDGSKIDSSSDAGSAKSEWTTSTDPKEVARMEKAAKIIEFLGGEDNIVDVDSCASRLRLTVKDGSKVDKDGIISLGGATGALVKGTNIQVVYGGEQEAIKPRMKTIIEMQRAKKVKA